MYIPQSEQGGKPPCTSPVLPGALLRKRPGVLMRLLAITLAALTVLIQYPLWFGKGGWLRVAEMEGEVQAQRDRNAGLAARNGVLDAEVRDLKQGLETVEELARFELGMIRRDEVFFQIVEPRPAERR